ncbi:Uncharacterised protein [Vibrio cholerae]|nr:Uncharacterised protein [Vibrio cholerae]CSB49235.1 Uncharacterised protein [Vibrio cholerae]
MEAGFFRRLISQRARIEPICHITFSNFVVFTVQSQFFTNCLIRRLHRGFAENVRFQQTVVNHVAVFTNRRSPCCVHIKAHREVGERLVANLTVALVFTNTIIEVAGFLRG